ncbi:MAG: atpase badf/badg/bcra/bcrd type [Parcubacteria group bacterium Gr01-1014_18]|nr:MAG: atpase badf/badg/bcra/bcrd type [Parcubacteria group bacterium Greene0416_36]TSC81550.1 MAG: atpase badf/badg/bcra/bcrd type [Parcubacteria group bacterium Gr01-1014_18]TSC99639.1 MAG: atpase badf/badg/bcra/bcrd type [Parcubacteria group bacterium Greene1014_20]TSD07090.1 MAG: atpase badf/badg/bcra/bcrd type [Parcubacteria group bacterium Greene0714_2]
MFFSPTKKESFLLGVDAGATKTEVAIADMAGKILFTEKGGPGSWNTMLGRDKNFENIEKTIAKVWKKLKKKGAPVAAAYLGMAGLDMESDEIKASILFKKMLRPYRVAHGEAGNDIKIVFPSASDASFGVSLIAGTGTHCYGANPAGESASSSGLDYLLADQGGGYWLGRKILEAAAKSYDGRGPKTKLEKLVMGHFKIHDFRDILRHIYAPSFGKSEMGELAMLLDSVDPFADSVVRDIQILAVSELFDSVHAVITRLKLKYISFDLVIAGSILHRKKYIRSLFIDKMAKFYPKANLIFSSQAPVAGAVKLALLLSKK